MIEERIQFLVLFVLLVAFGLAVRADGPDPVTGPTIVLPTFAVTADIVGYDQEAGWRYCSLPGLEVLGKGSDSDFKDALRDFLIFRNALDTVWPKALTSGQLPAIVVFCDSSSSFNKFLVNSKVGERSGSLKNGGERIVTTGSARSLSKGDEAIVVLCSVSPIAHYTELVKKTYVDAILGRIEKDSSPWLNRGLLKAFMGISYSNGTFLFPPLTTDETLRIRRAGSVEDLEKALKAGKFFTLEQLFSAEKAPPGEIPFSGQKDEGNLNQLFVGPWSNECYEFVHLCLFGADGKYREPFLKLANLAAKQPIDETSFRSLFGMGFQDMLLVLWRTTDCAKATKFKIGKDKDEVLAALPKIEFRDATDAEFSRIRGEALLAGKWFNAHYAFIAAYLRGARDPELLASLGIQEALFDKDERALKFLEAAASAHTTRARAYAELARLRCKAAFAKPEGEGRKLSAAQIRTVLEPLSIAFKLPPALPLPYQVLTAMWSEAAVRPIATDLAVINQGVERFPFDSDLTYNDAVVHLQYGYTSEALALAEFGLRMARNEKDRARFIDLRTSMGPK